jgi:organic hydroperoxide reductase OsmC/OhrA
MASPLPHRYQVHLEQHGHDSMLSSGSRPPLVGGPPPEFGGQADWWSPEHLLVSSVALCFTATFRSLASRTDLSPRLYSVDAEGRLDTSPEASDSSPSRFGSPWRWPPASPIWRTAFLTAPNGTAWWPRV